MELSCWQPAMKAWNSEKTLALEIKDISMGEKKNEEDSLKR